MKHTCLPLLLFVSLLACAPPGSFNEAERTEKLGRYSTAIGQYEAFSKLHARDKRAPEALFRIGEIYRTVIADYPKAQGNYRNAAEWYPESPWAKKADWALMNCPDYFPFAARKRILGDSPSGGLAMQTVEVIRPSEETSTGGSTISSSQYRLLAETSPGSVKLSRLDSATLWARPMPDSSMPPHHTGIPLSRQMS